MKTPKNIQLANLPTPVGISKFNDAKFYIKRDDLTGVELSGNKVRKLEYLFADAKRKNAEYVFTCGGEQSNHCRATAIAASAAGLKCKLFLWGADRKNASGNLFLDKLSGAEFYFVNKKDYLNINALMEAEKKKYEAKGKNVYLIPEGGSSDIGIWGYINFVKELKQQINRGKVNAVLTACGSGGTTAGLLLGSMLFDFPLKIFAVNVLYDKSTIYEKIISLSHAANSRFRLNLNLSKTDLEILDGYSEEGYKHISNEKVKVIVDYFKQSGILFDPAYTGKAFYAFNDNFLAKGKTSKVMFLHTGGLFGVFGKRAQYLNAVN